jgi:hypothetical protein
MDIKAVPDLTGYAPAREAWAAFDTDTYDCDCDQDGYFSTSLVGYGATADEAIADLLAQLEENPNA